MHIKANVRVYVDPLVRDFLNNRVKEGHGTPNDQIRLLFGLPKAPIARRGGRPRKSDKKAERCQCEMCQKGHNFVRTLTTEEPKKKGSGTK